MSKAGVTIVPEGRLLMSKAPTAELGAAATLAQQQAGLRSADFVIVAVEPGLGDDALAKALEVVAAAHKAPKAAPAATGKPPSG